jgi:hypothetical protein
LINVIVISIKNQTLNEVQVEMITVFALKLSYTSRTLGTFL